MADNSGTQPSDDYDPLSFGDVDLSPSRPEGFADGGGSSMYDSAVSGTMYGSVMSAAGTMYNSTMSTTTPSASAAPGTMQASALSTMGAMPLSTASATPVAHAVPSTTTAASDAAAWVPSSSAAAAVELRSGSAHGAAAVEPLSPSAPPAPMSTYPVPPPAAAAVPPASPVLDSNGHSDPLCDDAAAAGVRATGGGDAAAASLDADMSYPPPMLGMDAVDRDGTTPHGLYPPVPASGADSIMDPATAGGGAVPWASPAVGGSYTWHGGADSGGPTYSVSVGPPEKVAGGTAIPGVTDGTYVSFTISSVPLAANGASGGSTPVRVNRRFKDVVALADLLQDMFPGHFVPPRPRRNAVQGRRMLPSFLEARRASLERFLNRLSSHPAIKRSDALRVFLEQTGELRASMSWVQLCMAQQVHANSGHLKGAAALLSGLVPGLVPAPMRSASEVSAVAVQGHPDVYRRLGERLAAARGTLRFIEVTPLESSLRAESTALDEAHKALVAVATKARTWSSALGGVGDAQTSLSRSLNVLGSYEADCGRMPGRDEAVLADGCAKAAQLAALCVEHSDSHLGQLDDYAAYLPNARAAMARREGALLMLVQLEADLAKRRAKLADALSKPALFGKRDELQAAVSTLEGAVSAARSEYNMVSEVNAHELVSMRAAMKRDLTEALRQFVVIQAASSAKEAQLWQETAAALPPPLLQ